MKQTIIQTGASGGQENTKNRLDEVEGGHMHPRTICIITALALAGVAFAEPSWVSFGKGTEGQTPQLEVLESSAAGTAINLETYGMWVEDVKENEETYQMITLTGSSFTCEVGKPMLPVVRKLVAIPATAGVTVKVEVNSTTTFKDYLVYPTQEPQMGPSPEPEFQKDEEFYKLDTLYPVELSEAGAPAIMNDVRLVELAIQPFRYNPAKKELTVATDLTVRLDYSGFDERNVLTKQSSYFSPQWESIYRSLVLNFEDIYSSAKTSDVVLPVSHYLRYLIIYAYDFRPSENPMLQQFIDWKKQMGFIVETENLNNIPGINGQPDDTGDVKAYIYDWWYNNGLIYPGPVSHYVLLVGDARDINYSLPVPECYFEVQKGDNAHIPTFFVNMDDQPGHGILISDYPYHLLAGDDDYPEIAVGRWCIRDITESNTCVDKVFKYERDISTVWQCERALLVAMIGSDFQPAKEYIDDNILPSTPTPLTQYGNLGGNNDGVINAITTAGGVGIVNYNGHGVNDCWWKWFGGEESFDTLNIERDLNQSPWLPVVYNMACLNGAFATPDTESMVEAWIRDTDGGAVGTIGASRWTNIPRNGMMDTTIFRSLYSNLNNCVMAVNCAKTLVINEYKGGNFGGILEARAYNWIGDPALDVWRVHPVQAYLELSSSPPNILNVDVLTSGENEPVYNAQVCVHREGGGYHDVKFTGINGRASFLYPTSPGTYLITATNQQGPICIRPAFNQFTIGGGGGQEGSPSDIVEWQLKPLSPNPFRSSVAISYSVAGRLGSKEASHVEINVFDISGRQVNKLVAEDKNPGYYEIVWDGKDNLGTNLPTGVYLIRMNTNEFNASKRVILLR